MIENFYRNSEVSQRDHGGSRKFHADISAPSCGKSGAEISGPWNHLRGEPNLLHLMRVRILIASAPPRGVSKVSHLYGSRIFATARHTGGMPKVSSFINTGISAFTIGIRKIILQIGFKSKRTAVLPTVPFYYSGVFMQSANSANFSASSALSFSLTALRRSAAAAFCSSVISTFLGG